MTKPLLSIGIIFKNEIRCIERCLKSLEPLRKAIPCELVMADTGSDDGSRAVAERYADILFDFPWIDDFAAARNAVMDRCSGQWYMGIDCDEWMDANIQGFIQFLTTNRDFDFASVIIRNYDTPQLEAGGSYSDFMAVRLLRMSTGIRYEGTIHEHWPYKGDLHTMLIRGAVFHHDGYVNLNPAEVRKKQARNMKLLQKQLEADPENLIVLTQCIESSANMREQEGYLRRAITGVDEKWLQWELFGPPIYRHAVRFAMRDHLPELEDWIHQAEEKFPDSIFTRVETAYFAFGHYWNEDDYPQAICWGERYLQGVADYHAGNFNRADILASSLDKTDDHSRLSVATVLASGYLHEKQPEKCVRLMETLELEKMAAKEIGDCVQNYCRLYSEFGVDTSAAIRRFWDRLNEEQRTAFVQKGAGMFTQAARRREEANPEMKGHGYAAFLPLEGECELGRAAAVLEAEDTRTLEEKLAAVEKWDEFPIQALAHALEHGAAFPLTEKPLKLEEMDVLATRLAAEKGTLFHLALAAEATPDDPQRLCWFKALVMAAVQTFDWGAEILDAEQALALARRFAEVEKAFLSRCYAPEALTEEGIFLLPSMHRFGWYCGRAFDALDAGDMVGFVRHLRAGLESSHSQKKLTEFLLKQVEDLEKAARIAAVPPELKALADQVRVILARFEPDDPAVMELKTSEIYQQVAWLLEN